MHSHDEGEARLCPVIERALFRACGIAPSADQTRQIVAYVERIKTACWREITILLWARHVTPNELADALVNVFTDDEMPEAWRDAPRELTKPIEMAAREGN